MMHHDAKLTFFVLDLSENKCFCYSLWKKCGTVEDR